MEAAGVWKAPGRHPPTPGPSHTPWKSWAPAPRPPRIPTAPTAPATRSYILLGKTRKEAPRRPLEPNMSRRPSLRSDEWSPSSEQVVAFVGIRMLISPLRHLYWRASLAEVRLTGDGKTYDEALLA